MVNRIPTGILGLDDKIEGGFVEGSINFVTGKTGTGKCIGPDVPILLSNGQLKTSEEIFNEYSHLKEDTNEIFVPAKNLEVLSLNPNTLKIEPKKVKWLYRQKIDQNLIRVRTTSGREIKTTKEHPFVCLKEGRICYVHASEIKRGDYIAVPRKIEISQKLNDGGFQDNNLLFPNIPHTMKLALQVAEDDESAKKSLWYLRFHNKDETKLEKYSNSSKKLFDYEPKRSNTKIPSLRIFSKNAIEQLRNLGLKVCTHSAFKQIPEFILSLNDKLVALFLREYFDCEASVIKRDPEIQLSTASKEIANQILCLLLRFGIVGRLRIKSKSAKNGKNIKRTYYEVVISGSENLMKFDSSIGFSDTKKENRLKFHLKKKSNSNVDILPNTGCLLKEIRKGLNQPATKMEEVGIKQMIYMYENSKRRPSREMLKRFIQAFERRSKEIEVSKEIRNKIEFLKKLVNSDIFWDEVKEVEEVKPNSPYVYDFTVEDNHTFISGFGCIITHNTAFCASFLYEGALRGERGIYVTTEEREEDIKADIKAMFNWDLERLEEGGLLKFISIRPELPLKIISGEEVAKVVKLYMYELISKIEDTVKEFGAKRLVVDSIALVEAFIKDEYLRKIALMQFFDRIKNLNVTTILTGTVPEGQEVLSTSGIIEFLTDSVIKLDFVPIAEEYKRTLTIRKMRRTDHSILIHPFEITKYGMKIIEIV